MWGNTLDYKQLAWGNALVWGNNTTWGKALVWGNTNPVWDDPNSWGQALVWGNSSMLSYADGSALVWGNLRRQRRRRGVAVAAAINAHKTLALANPEMK